jgi:hypothetical protein
MMQAPTQQMLLEASKPAQTSSIQLWHCWSFPGLRAIGARLHWIPVNIAVIYDRQLGMFDKELA